MKKLSLLLLAVLAMLNVAMAQTTPRIYGVRVWSETDTETITPPALLSFSADNPMELTEEVDLSQFPTVRAGACDGTTYYLLVSDEEGMLATGLWAVDLASKKISQIVAYDYQKDAPASIVAFDMAYNPVDKKLYAIGMDLDSAVVGPDGIDAELGTVVIDPATGQGTSIGNQGMVAIQTITFTAEGDMLGVADDGALWTINPANGRPMDVMDETGYAPAGLQSMATDFATGSIYWAALTEQGGVGSSNLVRIDMTEDWFFSTNDLGKIKDTTELVALYVDSNPISDAAPATPADLTVTPAANGAKSALIAWTNPSLTRAGQPLTSVDITVYANGEAVQTLPGLTPGAPMTFNYVPANDGVFEISVAASVNGTEGAQAFADAIFIGTDRPGAVAALTASRPDPDKYDITVAWQAPATGAENGWYDASQLTYRVVRRPDGKVIADGITATTVTDTDITATGAYIYDVTASTAAGTGLTASTAPCISGPAITLPYTMDLTDEADANLWTVVNGDNDQFLWQILKNWGGYDTTFRFYPETLVGGVQPTDDWLISPAFALEAGKHYAISYDLRLWGDLFPATYQLNIGQGIAPADLDRVIEKREAVTNDLLWETRSVAFTVDKTGDYNIGFGVTLANPVEIKGVFVREILKTDLAAVTVNGPTGVGINENATYTVTIENRGFEAVSTFVLSLVDADGTVLASRTVEQEIAALSSADITIDWVPAVAGQYSIMAKAAAQGDLDASNDQSSAIEVTVLPAGQWYDITDGKALTAFAPFYLRYQNSGAQTIYSADEMGNASAKIEGITYYYSIMGSVAPGQFAATIAMANTSVTDFTTGSPLDASEFTTVFDGTMTLDSSKKSVTVLFDTPFEYTGNSLCILTQHTSTTTASVIFDAVTPKEGNAVTAVYYNDNAAYDFTHNATYRDRPNVSLFLSGRSGVEDVAADNASIVYDRATRTIRLDREAEVKVYSMQGVLLLSATGSVIDASAINGPAIVTSGAATLKVIF